MSSNNNKSIEQEVVEAALGGDGAVAPFTADIASRIGDYTKDDAGEDSHQKRKSLMSLLGLNPSPLPPSSPVRIPDVSLSLSLAPSPSIPIPLPIPVPVSGPGPTADPTAVASDAVLPQSTANASDLAKSPPASDAIQSAINAAHQKVEWKPKRVTRNQPGFVSIRVNGGHSNGNTHPQYSTVFRPRAELSVFWSIPFSFIKSTLGNLQTFEPDKKGSYLRNLNLGLFRRGVSTNQNAIITKEVLTFSVKIDMAAGCYAGSVPYYAPRSPGTFVFRLFFDTSEQSRYQLGTSQKMSVEVQGRDLEPNLRFILSQFKTKKTSTAALYQLSEVLSGLQQSNHHAHGHQQHRNDGAGRAAWGCVCESRKVLDAVEKELKEKGVRLELLLSENAASNGDKDGELATDDIKALVKDCEREKSLLERKHRDVQVALAAILQAATTNPAAVSLFRQDQLESIREVYSAWCPLSETFTSGGSTSLQDYQLNKFGFVPNRSEIKNRGILDRLSKDVLENMKVKSPGPGFSSGRDAIRLRLQSVVDDCASLPVGTKLLLFGSSSNGFGAPDSDLDMCLALPDGAKLADPPAAMGRLAEDLEAAGMLEVSARLTARIPIVMFTDGMTKMECDISMQNPLAVLNTGLLATYARCDDRVRQLAYAVKRWSKARAINSPSDGTLSSYGWILMLLHYLQRTSGYPIVPYLQRIAENWPGDANKMYDVSVRKVRFQSLGLWYFCFTWILV